MAPLKRKLTNKTAVEKYKALKDLEKEISLDGQLQSYSDILLIVHGMSLVMWKYSWKYSISVDLKIIWYLFLDTRFFISNTSFNPAVVLLNFFIN